MFFQFIDIITCERSESENFFNGYTKIPPDIAENLEMLNSEMYILKIPGPDPPRPPLDPRLKYDSSTHDEIPPLS